jgi:hypothetical protein
MMALLTTRYDNFLFEGISMTTQIALSLELLCLLNWLLKHDQAALNALVKHAIEHGFIEELDKYEHTDPQQIPDNLYNSIADFLDYFEQTMIKQLDSVQMDKQTKEAILPALQKLETSSLDFKTIWLSMQQTKAQVHKAPLGHTAKPKTAFPDEQKAEAILFERLLKNWKPNRKETLN